MLMQQHSIFADREAELAFLERKHAEAGAKLVVIYGRRRVGTGSGARGGAKEAQGKAGAS